MFSKVGVVGCGTTGQSIALMIASHGIELIFLELDNGKIQEAFADIAEELDNRIDHWGMTSSEKRGILSRISGTLDYADFAECDLVIDAILSRTREYSRNIRKDIFINIEKHVRKDAIIATNSTTTVITELASELKYKDRCVSLHFSTASPDARIVEVVKGLYTSDEVSKSIGKFAKLIQKVPVHVDESPGLISVRVGVALISEACEVLMEGVRSKEDIDYTIRNSLGVTLGPFELADRIGIDRVVRWMDNLYNEFGDRKYKPSPILKKLFRANRFGRKSGEGFYKYDEHGNKIK